MPPPRTDPSRRTFLAGIAGVAIVGASTAGAILFNRDDTAAASASPTSAVSASAVNTSAVGTSAVSTSGASTAAAAPDASPATAAGTYKDGQYTGSGDYDSPAGTESVTVTVTLAADKVTATSATGSAGSGPSAQYQQQFLAAYAGEVVGRDVDSVSLSRVSGSSLTSNGFNAALEKIKSDAKA